MIAPNTTTRFELTVGALYGDARLNKLVLASPMSASWNQIASRLNRIESLRQAA